MLTLALVLTIAMQVSPESEPGEVDETSAPEPSGDDRASAAKLIGEGNLLLDQGRAAEALKRFTEAYDLFSSPTIFVSIAEAHLKLGNEVRAAEYYQRFLEEKSPDTAAKLIMLAEQRLEELAAELAVIMLETKVAGALVSIDDDPIGETPMPPQYLRPGLYRIGATKEGHVPFSTTVELTSGEARTIPMALALVPAEPSKAAITPPPSPITAAITPTPSDDDSFVTTWWFWTAVGATVAAGVTVGVVAGASGGDPFVPGGELGLSGTSSWQKL